MEDNPVIEFIPLCVVTLICGRKLLGVSYPIEYTLNWMDYTRYK